MANYRKYTVTLCMEYSLGDSSSSADVSPFFVFHFQRKAKTSSSAIAERPRDARVTSIRKIAKCNF